jgi:hypothetical protein
LILVIGIGIVAEFRSVARPDTGFLLDAATRVLDGARLYVDVVEINPPLIVALNLPAAIAARATGLSDILVYRLGFTLVLLGALALAWRWLGRALPNDPALRRALLLLLAFVLFPLAGQDYGEREHLVLALVVPYLLLTTVRAAGGAAGRGEAAGVGLLAGLAFALKPHFLLVWVAMEGWLRLGRKVPAARPLPETLAIGALLGAYGAAVLLITPQYLGMLRLLAAPYGRFLYDPFLHLLVTGPGAALTLFALLVFVALRDHAGHPVLWRGIALGTFACFLSGAAQQKGLRYHFYPSFALAVLILGLAALDARGQVTVRVRRLYRAIAVSVLVTTVLVVGAQNALQAVRLGRDHERERFGELVETVRAHAAGERVFVMSYHIGSAYPLVNYSGARSASRFGQLWILAADYLDELKRPEPLRYRRPEEMSPSERYLNTAVREDLEANRPKLLLVLRSARDLPVNGYRRINYVAYFRRDERIARVLDRYQWLSDVGDYSVYERTPDGVAVKVPPSPAPGTHDVIRADTEGMHLRLQDPTFLFSIITFLVVLAVAIRGAHAAPAPAVSAQGPGGEPPGT